MPRLPRPLRATWGHMKGRFLHRPHALVPLRAELALFDAIMAGAAGYLLKQMRGADLVGAVRAVAAGLMRLANRTRAQIVSGPVMVPFSPGACRGGSAAGGARAGAGGSLRGPAGPAQLMR